MSLRTCLFITLCALYSQAELTPDYEIPDIVRPKHIPTTTSPTDSTKIDKHFIDDFSCDPNHGITGWSNCNNINSQYHGPFNNINNETQSNLLFRQFQCNQPSATAFIAFSIAFDCNVAFTDKVILHINNNIMLQYNSATQQDILHDTLLSTPNCNWYVSRNITYSVPVINALQSFQLKFESILHQVNVIKNIVIFDIKIDCVTDTNIIERDEMFLCKKYYTNSNSKSNIGQFNTMDNNLLIFSLQYTATNTELKLSHFGVNKYWYWNIQFALNKKQIIVQNKSNDEVTQTIFPTKFIIKDEADCFLDIDNEFNVFWNCGNERECIWYYEYDTKIIYNQYDIVRRYLTYDMNDVNAKLTLLSMANNATRFYMQETGDIRFNLYKIALYDAGTCQLTKDMSQNDLYTINGGTLVSGYKATFNCDGDGVNIKMEMANINDWSWIDIWITSTDNNNIQIGMGTLIGNKADIIFSFDYNNTNEYNDLAYGWIGTSSSSSAASTNWILYDYYNSTLCDLHFIRQYNITQNILNYDYKYQLFDDETSIHIADYLWYSKYLMFDLSASAQTWIKIETETHNQYIIEFGKKNAKNVCDSRGDDINYYIIMNNECSQYNDYDITANTLLFWIQWSEYGMLQIGNHQLIGQSIILSKQMDNISGIKAINIGCNKNEICDWTFYARQQQLTLLTSLFYPQSKLLFTFDYDTKGIIHHNATVFIYSYSLNINYSLHIGYRHSNLCILCNNDAAAVDACSMCEFNQIEINVPDYISVAMHKTFDSEYKVLLRSGELLLAETKYIIHRTAFMNLSVEFATYLMVGDTLKINSFHINNDRITQSESYINLKCVTLGIDAVLYINYASNICSLCREDIDCVSCYDGIELFIANTSATIHKLFITSTDTFLTENEYEISMKQCGVGLGLNIDNMCVECEENYVNLFANDNKCHLCSSKNRNNGFQCKGASDILIDFNHWIAVPTVEENKTFEIVSSVCPPLWCCQEKNGCDFTQKTSSSTLCALHRDESSVLCGSCLQGYSEVYGSPSCHECVEDNYGYLLLLIVVAMIYAICISIVIKYNGENESEIQNKSSKFESITREVDNFQYSRLILNDYIAGVLISLFRPITYFYQSFSYILTNYSIPIYFIMPILQIFSIDLSINNNGKYFCFLSNLDALNSELWLLFLPFALFIAIFMIWLFLAILKILNITLKYSPNVLAMIWSVILLSFNTIITRLFKILSCKQIGIKYVHFYAPTYECYDTIWWFALISIVLILFFLCFMFYILFTMDLYQRQSLAILKTLINPYKSDCWYWEFIIILRRITICAFIVFKYINEKIFNMILAILLVFFLGFHLRFKPFKYCHINNMESFCLILFLLSFVVSVIIKSETFLCIFISTALLLPFLLFITRIYSYLKLYVSMSYKDGDDDNKLNPHQQQILFAAINRLPFYRKDIVLAIINKQMPYIKVPGAVSAVPEDNNNTDDMNTTTYIETDDGDTSDNDKDNTYALFIRKPMSQMKDIEIEAMDIGTQSNMAVGSRTSNYTLTDTSNNTKSMCLYDSEKLMDFHKSIHQHIERRQDCDSCDCGNEEIEIMHHSTQL